MTAFLALAVTVAAGLMVYYFAPRRGEMTYRPSQDSPHDRAFSSYDEQRLYRDLDAARTRETVDTADQLPATGLAEAPTDTDRGPLAA